MSTMGMKMKWKVNLVFCVALLAPCCFAAPLRLPTIFTENMVLQRDQAVPVWGNAGLNAQVTVEFASQMKTITADNDGLWRVDLDAMSASSTAQTFTVSSNGETIEYTNVLVGEVWLCSGQSNMAWNLRGGDEVGANHPLIRMYEAPTVFSASPQEIVDANWEVCTEAVASTFSAVAYFYAMKLQEVLDVPIGLVQSAWNGTRIEPWTPRIGFESVLGSVPVEYVTEFQNILAEIDALTELNVDEKSPTALYNAMIHPHVPFAIKGAIWYQGESNVTEGMLYRYKTEAQINGWRALWGYDFPYYFVQLAPFDYRYESYVLPEFWEAQSAIVEAISNTGMAVISDVGNPNTIHPSDKETPGTRLALLALDNTYGQDIVSTGPVFESMVIYGDTIEIYFDSAVGLTTSDGLAPDWFEIAGNYGEFTPAVAAIVNEHVVLSSPTVTLPVAMRFAWDEVAMPNLVNGAGLVASAFRVGEIEPPLFTVDPINEIFAVEDAAYSSSIADDVSNPEGYPLTFSIVGDPSWLIVDADGTLSGTPGAIHLGANVFTVQVDVTGGSDTAMLNITVLPAGTSIVDIVKWGQAGGDTQILTVDGNLRGQNQFPAVYNPATLVSPADGINGYDVNAAGRTNEFSGAFSNTNTTPVFVGNTAGDYMQLVYNGDFTVTPFETMVAWDSSEILAYGSSQLDELTVEFKGRSGNDVPTVSFVVETSAGWYVTDQTDTTGTSYKSFILDAASATFSGFNKFGVTAGNGQPDLSDVQSVGVFSSTTTTSTGWGGTFLRYIKVVTSVVSNQAPSFTDDQINEIDATEGVAYSSSIADNASDPDSNPMTFSKTGGPAWLSVDAETGAISGTPGDFNVGANVFTVQVDATGGSDTATLNIEVLNTYSGELGLADFAVFATAWQNYEGESNWNESCNLAEPDDVIDMADLAVFCENWLADKM